MNPDRRAVLAAAGLVGACASGGGQNMSFEDDLSAYVSGGEPDEVIELWPGGAPGAAGVTVVQETEERANAEGLRDRAVTGITAPTLSLFRPARADGSAMLIIPGGGYTRVVTDKEGFETARYFAARGAHAFVLLYRLPADGWSAGADTPLEDAQRAMRMVRGRAGADGFAASRIAAMGFSAGGHLCASLATRFDADTAARDAAVSARPDLTCLVYPVITMTDPYVHAGSREKLIGAAPSAARIAAYSPEQHARADMAPTMFIHASDDEAVPMQNSFLMAQAVRAAGVPTELHLFEQGGHGFGLRGVAGMTAQSWPWLVWRWGQRHGLFGG